MKIFKSNITLTFAIPRLNKENQQIASAQLKKFNWTESLFSFLLNLITSILFITHHDKLVKGNLFFAMATKDRISFWAVYYASLIFTGLCLLVMISSFLVKDNKLISKLICYWNLFSKFFAFSFLRVYVFEITRNDNSYYFFFFLVDSISRCGAIFLQLIEFIELLILLPVLLVSFTVFYSPLLDWNQYETYSYVYFGIFFLVELVMAYFLTREKKIKYFYESKMKRDIRWHQSVFDSTKSGFVKISNKQIVFVNKLMKEKLLKCNDPNSPVNNVDINAEISKVILKKLFTNVSDAVQDGSGDMFTFPNDSTDSFFETIKSKFIETKDTKFAYLGIKIFEEADGTALTYEIMYRYYDERECGKSHYEFIFNDVTRAKLTEAKNAEFKYKSLFLSKIAHEFKNPLICISELIEESNDIIETSTKPITSTTEIERAISQREFTEKIKNNFALVQSFSKYLIILIKDFDYFSGALIAVAGNHLNLTETNLDEVFTFVTLVINGLLNKNNKKDSIKFILEKDPALPETILTDEIKLKQVLINLCSNSIKFTNSGEITLSAKANQGEINVSVSDTGIGISEELQTQLFQPFITNKSSANCLGAGLGLTIVRDIASKIGNGIKFNSKLGEGSTFWFDLPYPSPSLPVITLQRISTEDSIGELNQSAVTVEIKHVTLMINQELMIPIPSNQSSPRSRTVQPKTTKYFNVIIADDDSFVRNSNIRIVKKIASELKMQINIIESEDGNDTVSTVISNCKQSKPVDLVISDETMTYLSGTESASIIKKLVEDKKIPPLPFYLVTAYENVNCKEVRGIFTKPLKKEHVFEIFKSTLLTKDTQRVDI